MNIKDIELYGDGIRLKMDTKVGPFSYWKHENNIDLIIFCVSGEYKNEHGSLWVIPSPNFNIQPTPYPPKQFKVGM